MKNESKKIKNLRSTFHVPRSKEGFSLIEAIVYVAILAGIFIFVVSSILFIADSFHEIRAERSLARSAVISLDKMTREIQNSGQVDVTASTLGSSPGELVLQPGNVRFYVMSGTIYLERGTVVVGPLTPSDVSVSSLVFRHFSNSESEGIKIELTLSSNLGSETITKNYYTSSILRESY